MLGGENGVTVKGRLFAVICNICRRKAFGDELLGMREYDGHAFAVQVDQVLALEVKAAAKA